MLPRASEIRAELPALWRLAWPVIVAELGWHGMTVVDTIIVGRVSAEALGGVAVGSALYFVVAVFGIGMLLGLDFTVAHAIGAGRPGEAAHVLRQGIAMSVVLGTLLIVVMRNAGQIYVWLGVEPGVLKHAYPYLDALSWSLLPLMLFTAMRRYLQAIGAVRWIMVILISANLINAVSAWLLVFGVGALAPMGARGAGWATCISRTYMMITAAGLAWAHQRDLHQPRASRVDWSLIARLCRLGLPAALQLILEVGVFALATALAGTLGSTSLAAHQVVLSVAGLTFMMPLGLSSASAVRVGHQIGAGERVAAAHSGWTAIALAVSIMSVNAVILSCLPRLIIGVFTPDTAVIATGATLMSIAAVFQIFDGVQVVGTGVLRGTGDTRLSMVANLVGHWVIGLPIGYQLGFVMGWGIVGLWIGLATGLMVVAIVLLLAWWRVAKKLNHEGTKDTKEEGRFSFG